jgi:hypothetical protein
MGNKKKKSQKQSGKGNLQGKNIDVRGIVAAGDIQFGEEAEERGPAMLLLMRIATFAWVLLLGGIMGGVVGAFIAMIFLGEDSYGIGIIIGLSIAFIGALIAAANVSRYK